MKNSIGVWLWVALMALIAAAGVIAETNIGGPLREQFSSFGAPVAVPVSVRIGGPLLVALLVMVVALAAASLGFSRTLSAARAPGVAPIFAAQIILGLILSVSAIAFSADVYNYVIDGRLWGVLGWNPYVRYPITGLHGDSVLRACLIIDGNPPRADSYGPLWTLIAALVAKVLANATLAANLWAHRALALLSALAATGGVYKLARSWDVRAALRRSALFATHPLVLYETAVGGHNDIMMVALAVWAFALAESWPLVAGLLLGASVAVKYATIVVAPFMFIKMARRNWGTAVLSFALALSVIAIAALPFLATANVASIIPKPRFAIGFSPIGLGYIAATLADSTANFGALSRGLIAGAAVLFVAVFVAAIIAYIRARGSRPVWAVALAALWSLPTVFPWYAQWISPMMVQPGRLANYVWWLGIFMFASYVFVVGERLPYPPLLFIGLVIVFGPVLLAHAAFANVADTDGRGESDFVRNVRA